MAQSVLTYAFLGGAIVSEVMGTGLLQKSEQFTRLWPVLGMVFCYTLSLFCLSHALKSMPLGIAYALWGGLGIVLTTAVGTMIFKQQLDLAAFAGIGLILAGVLVINLLSKAMASG